MKQVFQGGDSCMYLHCDGTRFNPENEIMDTEEKIEYSCDECNFKSQNKNNYMNHVKSNHKTQGTEEANKKLDNHVNIEALQKEIDNKQ